MTEPHRLDVHHHFVPPFWREELSAHGGDPSGWTTPDWTPETDLALMEQLAIRTACLSLTSPGVNGWGGVEQAKMARRVNDYAAELGTRHVGRYKSFATLPLETIDGALREVERTLDALGASGVTLFSNYGGTYIGDERFAPIWEELNRREAIVFIHPTMPKIDLLDGVPGPMLDFPYDTTRAAVSLLMNRVPTRFDKVRIILSHAGGFLPFGAYRFAGTISALQPDRSAASIVAEMKRFYFDTALSSSPSAMPSLLAFADPDRILFGSDIPYARAPRVAWFTKNLDGFSGLDQQGLRKITHLNAAKLLGSASGEVAHASHDTHATVGVSA